MWKTGMNKSLIRAKCAGAGKASGCAKVRARREDRPQFTRVLRGERFSTPVHENYRQLLLALLIDALGARALGAVSGGRRP